ncbi:MAG: sugar kinase [Candidatus Latescibacterota bacterium]|nr:sugar kinase [Candidatus Latescibacterota bacterium]RKY70725.1 MAG: sugar kinase [Candidatus Latescibacterota bacterium]
MRVLVVGSIALDTVKTPFGEVEDALGGSAVYFSAAARYFAPVDMVGVVGEDFPMEGLDFLRAGSVNIQGIQRMKGRTFRWSGVYGSDLNERETLDTQLNVFADFHPELPESYRDAPYVFLANIDPTLQLNVLDQVRGPKRVVCDTMNFWIEGKRETLLKVLKRTDIVVLNEGEVRQLVGESDLIKASKKVLELGPEVAVIKKGEHGALMVSNSGFFFAPAYPTEHVFDPTGAGDSFAGGFVGYLAQGDAFDEESIRRAVVYGSVMASFNVERFSVERLKALDKKEIRERLQAFREMVRVD